jgi:hypothetical protein
MALIRVAQYNSTPTVVGDYQAQNAHLQAFTNQLLTQQFILDSGTAQPVIKQGAYVSHGGSLYVADADTSITGSPSDGSVYIRVSGTTSLTVEFVTDISGYAWNPVYTALTSGSYTLLPYLIIKASAVWTRYNFNPNNQSFGDITSNTVRFSNTIIASDTLKFFDDTDFSTTSGSGVLARTFSFNNIFRNTVSMRIKMGFTRSYPSYPGTVELKLNGTSIYTNTVSSTTEIELSTDVTFIADTKNTLELYIGTSKNSSGTFENTYFRIYNTSTLPFLSTILADFIL